MSDQEDNIKAEDLRINDDNDDKQEDDTELELEQLHLSDKEQLNGYVVDDEVNIDNVDISDIPSAGDLRIRQGIEELKVDDLLDYLDRCQQKLEIQRAEALRLKDSKRSYKEKHRGSVVDLHNRMLQKLIDNESEQKTELEQAQDRILELQTETKKLQLTQAETEAVAKGDGDSFKRSQLELLIDENAKLEKKARNLEIELKDQKSTVEVEKLKHSKAHDQHRKSISTLQTNMFKKLVETEDEFEDKMDKLKAELSTTQRELMMERNQQDRMRRDSIRTVHNNMLTKLLDSQSEFDEKEEKYLKDINDLKVELRKEILRNESRADRRAERDGSVSPLETEQETRGNTPKEEKTFDDLWQEADEPAAEVQRLRSQIKALQSQLKEAESGIEEIEINRRDSIHNLHNNMFQKLLDAEFEYEEEIERLNREKEEENEKIMFYEEAFKKMNDDSGAMIVNPTEVIHLREQIKEKNEIIEDNKQRIYQLTQKVESLQVKVENEQKQRRGSVSFLSKQMMAKLLEAEEENEEQRLDFKHKLQKLEKELDESKEMSFNLEKTRRNSVTKVSQQMFHKLLVAEQTKKQITTQYEDNIKELERQLAVERLKNETVSSQQDMITMDANKYKSQATKLEKEIVEIKEKTETEDRVRRESMSQLQNSYWEKLLDAEDSHFEQIKKLKAEVVKLKNNNTFLVSSKLHLITECNKQMNDLRAAVHIYNKNASSSSWF